MSEASGMRACAALTRREWVRFTRQPSRIVATVGTPALIWLFAGAGLAGSFVSAGSGVGYSAHLLPGMVTMSILFSTIFAAISLIHDRQAGFLQSALVSPAPAWAIVGSKVVGGTLIATAQASLLLAGAGLVGLSPGMWGYAGAICAGALAAASVIGLGLAAAWWIDSTAGFHGVMNMLLMPMWLLSGALFPAEGASPWLAWLIRVNPLHWSTTAMARSLGVGADAGSGAVWAWVGTIGFAVAMFAAATIVMGRRSAQAGRSQEDMG